MKNRRKKQLNAIWDLLGDLGLLYCISLFGPGYIYLWFIGQFGMGLVVIFVDFKKLKVKIVEKANSYCALKDKQLEAINKKTILRKVLF